MRRYWILLKKEIKELLTLQMILPLIITIFVFVLIGSLLQGEVKKNKGKVSSIYVVYQDLKKDPAELEKYLTQSGSNVVLKKDGDFNFPDEYKKAKENKCDTILVVKPGFYEKIMSGNSDTKPVIELYSMVKSVTGIFSMTAPGSDTVYRLLKSYVQEIIQDSNSQINYSFFTDPLNSQQFIAINNKYAPGHPSMIEGFIMSQTMLIPIVIFMIIIFASQMVAVSIASEKENKTLETLLSMPINRSALATAKMLAGGIVSILMAGIYLFGFQYYMKSINQAALGGGGTANIHLGELLKQVGLSFSGLDFTLLGISVFLTILNALALSLILGVFAEDVKKVQAIISPIMILVLIPYFLSIFFDINSVSLPVKIIVYAIPFAHPFIASPNLFLNNYPIVLFGIGYQFLVFLLLIFIAGKIFQSDKILTMKLKTGTKNAFGKR